ncbi:YdcF family protein [Gordonia shandongensis]|uniref:YdcF family protein n=1 Tax=Gordonia shandongensis TaxID=376351 RepID=UPI0003F8D350|nr:YdcF family protein [Gordonia shandongensis]
MDPEWIPAIVAGAATVAAGVHTLRRIITDRRRPSNGLWLLGCLTLGWLTAALIALGSPDGASAGVVLVAVAPVLIIPILLLGTTVALVGNTPVVVRREGLRIATLVPLVIAIALAVTLGVGTWWLLVVTGATGDTRVSHVAVLFLPLLLIPGAVFVFELLAYTGYAIAYSRLDRVRDADIVVVLGAGLNGDRVTPLLASRLDRGIDVLRECRDAGRDARIVVSGGKGSDEVVSEAKAMSDHLVERGVDPDLIIVEDRSTTTAENLEFTTALLAEHGVPWERMAVVTSNFHVLRAASLTQRMGLTASAVGARTAAYYLPTAFLREFAAIVVHFRRGTLVTIAGTVVLWLLFAAATGLFHL